LHQRDELPTVTDAELTWLRLTREQLYELFAMGVELMRGKTVNDRVRPVAAEAIEGHWEVRLCPSVTRCRGLDAHWDRVQKIERPALLSIVLRFPISLHRGPPSSQYAQESRRPPSQPPSVLRLGAPGRVT
jgi:hypothetical protein